MVFGGKDNGLIGNFDFAWLSDLGKADLVLPGYTEAFALSIPAIVFCAYQMMFAVITPALITGAIADRMKFFAWVLFLGLWLVLVYAPVAHWVFSPLGWLFKRGPSTSRRHRRPYQRRIAALAVVIVLGNGAAGRASDAPPQQPAVHAAGHRHPLVRWFGFNAGSALGANGLAARRS